MRPRLDPELGVAKKNDDLYARTGKDSTGWRGKAINPRVPPRKTFRRIGLLILLAVAVYVFVANIPTDLGPQDTKRRPTYGKSSLPPGGAPSPKGPTPNQVQQVNKGALPATRDYDGPVRFLQLAETLHAISATKGSSPVNSNVLFLASSLKSADILLPIACQMSEERRAYVHFALASRIDIPIQQLADLNGIGKDCQIIFHDARPEFTATSSDERFEKAVSRALYHINNYMHPQALFVDSSGAEEPLFLKSVRESVVKHGMPSSIIELPSHFEERLSWVTKLDAASLLPWSRLTVDILIHAHADASGSLIRLLKSLSLADFAGSVIPHLTIELPEKIDPPTTQFLQDFKWPPRSAQNPTGQNLLTLRHRIRRHGVNEEESSAQFLESFWPANPWLSHVLVLSPQAELSPDFFHYLKMAILEYRYSNHALSGAWNQRLFGISLDLPSTLLGGTGRLAPPVGLSTDEAPAGLSDAPAPFLWQAPNSNAMLFTGDKWAELHNFVSQSLEAQHSAATPATLLSEKLVSKDYPAWMEHALRLCRGRGYWTLYPSPDLAMNLATIHTDLYRQPEEYENDGVPGKQDDEDEVVIHRTALLDTLPNKGQLPEFHEMPLLTWDGSRIKLEEFDDLSLAYARHFKQMVGGCDEEAAKVASTSLFCSSDSGI